MALSDWTVTSSNPAITATIDTGNPILDTGSLFLGSALNDDGQITLTSTLYTPGKTSGKIRAVMRDVATTMREAFVGFSFMHAALDVSPGNVACYGFYVEERTGGTPNNHIVLGRFDSGIASAPVSLFDQSGGWTTNVTFTMEVEWQTDVPGLGGIRIIGRTGTATDFSDLSEIVDLVDGGPSALTTSAGEGIMAHSSVGSSNVLDFQIDNTTISEFT